MTKWHCAVRNGCCAGTPDWKTEPQQCGGETGGYFSGGTCKANPETCGKYKSSQQCWDELPQEEKDRVSKPTYKETVARKEGKTEATEKPKSKTKAAKKLESEIAQGSMFK